VTHNYLVQGPVLASMGTKDSSGAVGKHVRQVRLAAPAGLYVLTNLGHCGEVNCSPNASVLSMIFHPRAAVARSAGYELAAPLTELKFPEIPKKKVSEKNQCRVDFYFIFVLPGVLGPPCPLPRLSRGDRQRRGHSLPAL
jgi:hypothetical protein